MGIAGTSARRVGLFAVTLLGATVVIFTIVQALPGDVAQATLGVNATPEAVDALRQKWGLDRPVLVRYFAWLGDLVTFDFGHSYLTGQSVWAQIQPCLAVTCWVVALSTPLAVLTSIPVGVVSALWRKKWQGAAASGLSQIGMAVPVFFTGVLLILVFAVRLRLLPPNGYTPLTGPRGDPADWLAHLVLPVAAVVIAQSSLLTRYVRSGFLEVLSEDYLRTARAVGWTRWGALIRHGTRNAALSVVTIVGLQIGAMLVGVIIVEQVFQLPGLGSLLLRAVGSRDLPVVQGIAFLLVAAVLVLSLLVDLAYLALDPRLRRGSR